MSVDHQKLLVKYAEKSSKRRLSDPAKRALAGAMAGITGIPLLQPLDTMHTRKMVSDPKPH